MLPYFGCETQGSSVFVSLLPAYSSILVLEQGLSERSGLSVSIMDLSHCKQRLPGHSQFIAPKQKHLRYPYCTTGGSNLYVYSTSHVFLFKEFDHRPSFFFADSEFGLVRLYSGMECSSTKQAVCCNLAFYQNVLFRSENCSLSVLWSRLGFSDRLGINVYCSAGFSV